MQLVITDDGSHTLYKPDMDEHYHSVYGALTESMHVFIQSGFNIFHDSERISIFEVGFGTGLNALLTCMMSEQQQKNVRYVSIEKYPLDSSITSQLNYPLMLEQWPAAEEVFKSLHDAEWNRAVDILPGFALHKICADILDYHPSQSFDLIFFDAFAPQKQSGIWTEEVFRTFFNTLSDGGILVSFCVSGMVKRMMKSAGFTIEKLPGPPGKREILRGLKKICIEK